MRFGALIKGSVGDSSLSQLHPAHSDAILRFFAGGGTITFGSAALVYPWYAGSGWRAFGHQAVPSFDLSDNARTVYEIIRGAQRAAKRHAEQGAAPDQGPIEHCQGWMPH